MGCTQTRKLISAYLDRELPDESRSRVTEHLRECASCSRELAGFQKLSVMADALCADAPSDPVPTEDDWRRLEELLDAPSSTRAHTVSRRWASPAVRWLAMAASLLLVLGIGWSGYWIWGTHHDHGVVLEQYLQKFERDPLAAQHTLVARYPAQAMDADGIARRLGYRPAVAEGLPEGYTPELTVVMKMPCCTCVQTLCRRKDGSVLVLFEHGDDHDSWFQGRPCTMVDCGGTACSLVGVGNQLAASWKRGKRHMTIVGAHDMAEVETIVRFLDDQTRDKAS